MITPETAKAMLEALREATAKIDAADRECPVRTPRKHQPAQERCTRCGATSSGNCGLNVQALWELEQTARAAIKQAEEELND